jgi:predicted metal-dependent hydrolase
MLGEDSISLEGYNVPYILKRSYRAQMIWLSFKPGSGLQVTVPQRYNLKDLPAFLTQHAQWILRHQAAYQAQPVAAEKPAGLGDNILILGKSIPVIRQNGASQNLVSYDGARLLVEMKTESVRCERLVFKWMTLKALKVISAKVEYWSALIKVEYNRITVRDQRSRWGSCSQLHNLNFNWRLIMVPEEVLDYVVIHELCHLKEMNHSKAFWQIVSVYCPQWREHRRWLNQHRVELHSQING